MDTPIKLYRQNTIEIPSQLIFRERFYEERTDKYLPAMIVLSFSGTHLELWTTVIKKCSLIPLSGFEPLNNATIQLKKTWNTVTTCCSSPEQLLYCTSLSQNPLLPVRTTRLKSPESGAKYLLGRYNLTTDEDDKECCRQKTSWECAPYYYRY